jgi:hypothetical protein
MKGRKIKIILFAVFLLSVFFNVLIIVSALANTSAFFSYRKTDNYFSGAQVVSVPEGRQVEFGIITVSLLEGDTAYLQYSVISRDGQVNYNNQYLFDGGIVNVENDFFGIRITALKEGEALLQVFSNNGFSNIANIIVRPREKE